MPLNREVVGKCYRSAPVVIDQQKSMFFALAVGDLNPAYLDPRTKGGMVVPPVLTVAPPGRRMSSGNEPKVATMSSPS